MDTQATPTDAELRCAFRRSGLWRLGWEYSRAIAAPLVRWALERSAIAHRRPATPAQPASSDPEPAMPDLTEIRLDADATHALRQLLRAAERVETDLLARGLAVAAELLIDADGASAILYAEGDPAAARRACERSGYLVDAIDWHTDDTREIATYRVRVERIDVGLIVTRRQQRADAHGVQPCTPSPQPAAAVPA